MKCSLNCKCIDCRNRINYEKKLFEINYDDCQNRDRFFSFDDNENKNNIKNFKRKIIQLQNKVIIDNYNIKESNNNNIYNNIIIHSNSAFSYNSNNSSKDVDKTTDDS